MSHPTRSRSFAALMAPIVLAIAACSTAPVPSPSPSPSPPPSAPDDPTPSAPVAPTPSPPADPTSPRPGDESPSPPAAGDPDALLGVTWVLVRMEGVDLPPDAGITTSFAPDGSFGGSGGCNQYGGRYTVDGDAITLSEVLSTLIGCDGVVGQREGSFFAALERVETWSIAEGRLMLDGPEGSDPLIFEPFRD